MSEKHSTETGRTASFSRNTGLESLLKDINSNLWLSEETLLEQQGGLQHPVILVMGPMRSGTTLFMQWLANTGLVAYPTNLLSRFYQAPIIGAKIQLLLTDPRFNFRDELGEFVQQAEYRSENGKTKGVLAPNEFWYFWRRFLAEPGRDVWTDEELRQSMDTRTMLAELAGMMQVFQKPFAAKGMLFNYNIPFLDSVLDKVLFIQIRRDPVANIASVLDARKRQLGSEEAWYSFKIPEYEELMTLDPVSQVAGQVHHINRAVSIGLSGVAEQRKLVVQYEDFCAAPRRVFEELAEKLMMSNENYIGPERFKITRSDNLPNRAAIEKSNSLFKHD
ncbi:sulfotransferase [Ferrigenium sp. UT5]|uniref:sulfotransferase n=1 Tax=Ferrigenium sp. UT5 TaxID=3242105 RepID=UPI003554644C